VEEELPGILARLAARRPTRQIHALSPQNPIDGGIPFAPPVDSTGYSMVYCSVA